MKSLGWAVAEAIREHLPDPGDPRRPFLLTEWQLRFLLDLYALDKAGAFVYRRAAMVRAKGTGKSPLMAAVAIMELAGPVRFAGWDADGEPIAELVSDPLVQVGALSVDQADANVFSMIFGLLTANDGAAATSLGVDVGRGRLYLHGRPGKLEAITASAGAREGQRLTAGILEESHLMTPTNGGTKLARTMRRNAGKTGGITVETANAPELSIHSVCEATMAAAAAGEAGILLDTTTLPVEPDSAMTDDQLRDLIAIAYVHAPWIDQTRILSELRDPATGWAEGCRYFLNVPSAAATALVDPARWTELAEPGHVIADGARVALGFDGANVGDATALVLCTEDGYLSLELLIERDRDDPSDWQVPRAEAHAVVDDLFARYEVVRFLADPWLWRDELDTWARKYGEVVLQFPTNSIRRMGPAVDRFRVALANDAITHDGDPDLARHLGNARLTRGRGAADDDHPIYTLAKAGPGRFMDAAIAAVLAYEAMATAEPVAPELVPLVAFR